MKTKKHVVGVIILLMSVQLFTYGQISSTSALSGIVSDPSGAVIEGASIEVKSNDTGATFSAKTAGNGAFTVPALINGSYTVTVSASGFKQVILGDVKVNAGKPASVRVTLEVGATSEAVNIQGGGEVVQTQTANITTTLVSKEIEGLPVASRDLLVLLTMLPGFNTPGNYRSSTINGFTRSGVNIMIDGINTQDNLLKDNELFTFISPRVDAIEEVTVSTATPGAESSGQGSVQIRFVTRQGNNEYHGSLYEYHRNTALNSNYWFNNRDLPPDPKTGKAPRDRIIQNQFGFRVGGPIVAPKKAFGPAGFDGHNKAFFFINQEQYRLPDQISRQRTVLNPLTQQGVFQYNTVVNGQNVVRQVNLLNVAASNGQTATVDPTVGKLLSDIRNSTATAGSIQQLTDPNLQRFTFSNGSMDSNSYTAFRLDFNLTNKHHLENVYNVQAFSRGVDILNNRDPAFPGFPVFGGQKSTRFSNSTALRSSLTSTLVNEARFGFTGGTVHFFENVSPGAYSGSIANQEGFSLGIGAAGISGVSPVNSIERRNTPVWQLSDNLNWLHGPHNLNFGAEFTQVNSYIVDDDLVPTITFGLDANDPANRLFTAANFPGASSADLGRAANIYSVLTGRVIQIGATAFLNEKTNKYAYQGPLTQRTRQRELGFFGQDSWRMRPNLTVNYGLRWEVQLPFTALNNIYTTTTVDGLFGVSGRGNIFKPGVLQGSPTQFTQFKAGDTPFDTRLKNFAPSLGLAWSPNFKNGLLKRFFGDNARSVLRAGYSMAYNRRAIVNFSDNINTNPGNFITATRNQTLGNLVSSSSDLPLLLRDRSRLGPPSFPETPTYPITGAVTNAAIILDPHLKTPYGQSWSLSFQREIARDTAIEVRYVGTHTVRNLETINFNEVNIVENGFLDEFKNAIGNLRANIAGGRGTTFRYFGPNTGTAPLPIILGYFSGNLNPASASSYTSTLFANTTFVNLLAFQNPAPYTFASNLYGNAGRRGNALLAGLAPNLFHANPGLLGGVGLVTNGASQSYDSGVIELRRRLSKGLLVQGSYSFSKATTQITRSLRVGRVEGISTENIPNAIKADWVYELPFGRGHSFFSGAKGPIDRVVGGWEFHGTARIQSGVPINLGNVRLVGMSRADLQKVLKLRFDDKNKVIYSLPQDIIDNTIKAFNVSATSADGYGSLGAPTGRFIAPANNSGCVEVITGDCGGTRVVVYGPWFTRFDLAAVKKTRITERVNFELRAEFLNAFNNANFNVGLAGFGGATFGQVTSAYRDNANTNDPGGRIIQLVGRINF